MATQNCPKCGSDRVRRGYLPTSIFSKIFFRYNLLCDNCNWEFKGFALPGTVSSKPTRNPNKRRNENAVQAAGVENLKNYSDSNQMTGADQFEDSSSQTANEPTDEQTSQRVRKKIKVRL
jgi:ribosomal protein L37AE/L43A